VSRDVDLYLHDIVEACDRVARYTAGYTLESFALDSRTVDAVVRNLEILGEAAKRVPGPLRAQAASVPWRQMAGLRDVVAHAYFGVDLNIVWDVATNHLPRVREDVAELLRHAARG
jgi:uncharacterized protein with HEPN domain